jgi:hypothetical protein
MVSASTRRFPSTSIRTPWATATFAVPIAVANEPKTIKPKRAAATPIPRTKRTLIPMPNWPQIFRSDRPSDPEPPNAFYRLQVSPQPSQTNGFQFAAPTSPPSDSLRRPQMEDVVDSGKNHQHYDDCKADPEPDLLGPLRERPAARSLDQVEQKVTAIEQGHRKQV